MYYQLLIINYYYFKTKCFKAVDEDGSGFIEHKEFKGFIEKLYNQQFTDEEAQQLMGNYDTNKDGKISWEEFKDQAVRELNTISSFYQENIFDTEQPKQEQARKERKWEDLTTDEQAFYTKVRKNFYCLQCKCTNFFV